MYVTEKKTSSGVAKAGLTTGITGASLGVLNALGGLAGIHGWGAPAAQQCCPAPMCNEDHLVDRYTLDLVRENDSLKTQNALRDANIFTDQKTAEVVKYFEGRLREVEAQLCNQAVTNQKTADSFQLVSERLQCCCDSMDSKLAAEAAARQCADERLADKICCETKARKQADNSLVSYMNSTFYAKQVGTVSTTTPNTSQILYNPLPVDDCCC